MDKKKPLDITAIKTFSFEEQKPEVGTVIFITPRLEEEDKNTYFLVTRVIQDMDFSMFIDENRRWSYFRDIIHVMSIFMDLH
jgi:hypothetical protein